MATGSPYPKRESDAAPGAPADDRSPEDLRAALADNIAAITVASREQR